MIPKSTVLILGAGASRMYGFPSGAELKEQVVQTLSNEGVGTVRSVLRDGIR
ncbi:MAG: hypothetical protein HYR76_14035 [Ignavibacteria bacterium]|nr:hypothetical protein [Ignavibacteria bacterium]